jgi:hypothetical protein
MSHLTVVGDVADPGGMASTVLAEAKIGRAHV